MSTYLLDPKKVGEVVISQEKIKSGSATEIDTKDKGQSTLVVKAKAGQIYLRKAGWYEKAMIDVMK